MRRLRVVVISDLHVTTESGDSAGSWLTTHGSNSATRNPIQGLADVIGGAGADLVLCCGDLADKADPTALQWAWGQLNDLSEKLGAKLIATAGNHDVDSRHKVDLDPRGALFDLEPPFPVGDIEGRDAYWARNYSISESETDAGTTSWRVVTLNSCAFHGYVNGELRELDHGRVSPRTVARLERELAELGPVALQVLLVHHHLEPLPHLQPDGHSQIQDAQQLIDMLERTSQWLVIHGHQHQAHVQYAHGSGGAAAIFAAGSIASHAFGQLASTSGHNQAYLLEFATGPELEQLQLDLALTFRSWNWYPDVGWKPAGPTDNLPGVGGLGWRPDRVRIVAEGISKMIGTSTEPVGAERVLEREPRFAYLSPVDLQRVVDELSKRYGIGFTKDDAGAPSAFRRRLAVGPEDTESQSKVLPEGGAE